MTEHKLDVKMILQKYCEDFKYIDLVQDSCQLHAFVMMVLNILVSLKDLYRMSHINQTYILACSSYILHCDQFISW
jgi:hypothetical protein